MWRGAALCLALVMGALPCAPARAASPEALALRKAQQQGVAFALPGERVGVHSAEIAKIGAAVGLRVRV